MATTATNNNKNMALEAKLRASVPGPPGLPVIQVYEEFVRMLKANQAIIACSQTGSGKSTQIPRYVLNEQLGAGKMVACTQPRRYVTITTAGFVAESMNVELVYLTDGKLLAYYANGDPQFSGYSCIIIDEALERTLNTDILMAKLKVAMASRKNLKVIIMAATLDANKFSSYFGGAPILTITHPFSRRCIFATVHQGGLRTLLARVQKDWYSDQISGLIQPDGSPSEDGKRANNVPVSPIWFNCLREAHRFGCVEYMLTIVAIENTDSSIFCRPRAIQWVADEVVHGFAYPQSDHITNLNAVHAYLTVIGKPEAAQWCSLHFLHKENSTTFFGSAANCGTSCFDRLRKAARGLFTQTAFWDRGHQYRTLHENAPMLLHPNSALRVQLDPGSSGQANPQQPQHSKWTNAPPQPRHECIVYSELLRTSRAYGGATTAIEPEWIADLPHFQAGRFKVRFDGVTIFMDKAWQSLEGARYSADPSSS
ncbi:hypothetical protein PG990_007901 [Apiospora arundinis]